MPKIGKRKPEHLNVRLPVAEMEALRRYCEENQRSQSDVIREFIRSLKPTVASSDSPRVS
ncbi:MAG: ribbon-helix-helix protein, CopG family [Tildeniella nuda ZEHNDER 1965/U140]|nr:ribbon-helix-helix protein, CopG family [Tildeniella nuda ZEHNDER 1965/U140]